MIGHHPIVAMRLQGCIPEFGICIETDSEPTDWPIQWAAVAERFKVPPSMAHIHIGPTEALNRLDLRFCVGIEVRVEGMISKRVREVLEACDKAGAKRVIGSVAIPVREVYSEVIEIMDSKGVATWQA